MTDNSTGHAVPDEGAASPREHTVDARRWLEAARCARSVIDEFFAGMDYGDPIAASVLAERIADLLDAEGRLS